MPMWAEVGNARHECLVMDASVSVKAAETAELETKSRRPSGVRPQSDSSSSHFGNAALDPMECDVRRDC